MEKIRGIKASIAQNQPVIICVNQVGYISFSAKELTVEILQRMFKLSGGTLKVALSVENAQSLYGQLLGQGALPTVLLKGEVEETLTGKVATIRELANNTKALDDFNIPGEISQVIAAPNGVLDKMTIIEAATDFMKISIGNASAVFMEIHTKSGDIASLEEVHKLAEKEQIEITSILDILDYRKQEEQLVHQAVDANLPTQYGDFHVIAYNDDIEHKEYLVISKGDNRDKKDVLVRLHSECFTGDVLGSKKCDCGEQLHLSLNLIEQNGSGLVIYLRQEGRGIGLINKLKAYNLQAAGYDTVEANHQLGFLDDLRDYAVAAQILKDLGIKTINLLTNNPTKISGIEKYGITVTNRLEIEIPSNADNKRYMQTKKEKMGHILEQDLG